MMICSLNRTALWRPVAAMAVLLTAGLQHASAETVRLTVENVGPAGTTFITPVFAGFHDGSFDLSNGGVATAGLTSLAELGMTGGLTSEFTGGGAGRVAGTLNAGVGPIAPGQTVTQEFVIGNNDFLTLATMVLPSSDFFLGNISTPAFDLSSLSVGNPLSFTLSNLYDAGTELNDFATSPGNPLLGLPGGDAVLSAPDSDGTIRLAGADPFSGFLNAPAGGFSPNISQLRVTVSAVPEPGMGFACAAVICGLVTRRRRRK